MSATLVKKQALISAPLPPSTSFAGIGSDGKDTSASFRILVNSVYPLIATVEYGRTVKGKLKNSDPKFEKAVNANDVNWEPVLTVSFTNKWKMSLQWTKLASTTLAANFPSVGLEKPSLGLLALETIIYCYLSYPNNGVKCIWNPAVMLLGHLYMNSKPDSSNANVTDAAILSGGLNVTFQELKPEEVLTAIVSVNNNLLLWQIEHPIIMKLSSVAELLLEGSKPEPEAETAEETSESETVTETETTETTA